MNLLVHRNLDQAKRALQILGLDGPEWMACGYGQELGGRQFDKIVVIVDASAAVEYAFSWDWMREVLPLKLSPGHRVEFL